MEQKPDYHVPVLLRESIDALNVKAAGVYVDCTFGGGGHSREILKRLGPEGRLVAFDQDAEAQQNLPDDPRVLFVPHNFRHLARFLRLHKIQGVDGILADLGVSSHQFDQEERGFSTRGVDASLNMRMDQRQEFTAEKLLATYSEIQLHKLFEKYGEVTNAKTLARTIVEGRGTQALKTIADFKQMLAPVVKGNPNKYFAQVFQALRIEVNDEMGALKEMLTQVPEALNKDGRIAVITFHSIEDRIVKQFFRSGSFEEEENVHDLYGGKREKQLEVITRKPITPGDDEIKKNPRSRSAKLRVAKKV